METTAEQATRLAAIADLYDAGTIAHLSRRGVDVGWRCLEVGGGNGSIARWLSDRVGRAGHVVATDVDTRFFDPESRLNLDLRQHDITCDPLPAGAFDLIHARLVLIHLPARDWVLRRLAGALAPGGWLLIEEFDSLSVLPDPPCFADETLLATHVAMGRIMGERGADRRYGRRLVGRLRALGLGDVGAEARMTMIQGGSSNAALLRATYGRLRRAMIEAGYITDPEFARDLARLDDPDFLMPSPALWAVWGRRP
jgi:SAM-dependent methyltransferase